METINKYCTILEGLKFSETETDDLKRIKDNEEYLRPYFKPPPENSDTLDDYISHLYYIVQQIKPNLNLESSAKEDLVSVRHTNLFAVAIAELSRYSIRSHLPVNFKRHPMLCLSFKVSQAHDPDFLVGIVNLLVEIMKSNAHLRVKLTGSIFLEIMAVMYSEYPSDEACIHYTRENLNFLWNYTPKHQLFKNLLILKSISDLPTKTAQQLHVDLLSKLTEPGGFKLLIQSVGPPEPSLASLEQERIPDWKRFQVVSNIVGRKGHSKKFYETMIKQIIDFIRLSISDESATGILPAGRLSLRQIYFLSDHLKTKIENELHAQMKPLYEPEDIIAGSIIFEYFDFKLLIHLFFEIFCGSSFSVLPSNILTKYVPLFLNLYSQIPIKHQEKHKIGCLLIQCLMNREKAELHSIISFIFGSQRASNTEFETLHPRISVNFVEKFESYNLQIVPADIEQKKTPNAITLSEVLLISKNNILIYNVFICLLRLLNEQFDTAKTNNNSENLIYDEQDLEELICIKMENRIMVIVCLQDLVDFKPFQSQFYENPHEIIDFMETFIRKRMEMPTYDEMSDKTLTIVFQIFLEILKKSKSNEPYKRLCATLKKFLVHAKKSITRTQVKSLIDLIEDGSYMPNQSSDRYAVASALLTEEQPHRRVQGISMLINLLKERDEQTVANRYSILAIGLKVLRDQESYTYLNCIRLFVTLVDVLHDEVIEALSAEYSNKNEPVEYRLKVGETILKITEQLGQLSYKYKNSLMNGFLVGCRSELGEFRASSFSNLATLCRLFSYDIHHFFQEFLSMLGDILQTETYLPAKRAAVMVLSELLKGMDSIADFEEYLLPIYKLLCIISKSESDAVTRVHATNGLKTLSEKCISFLFPKQRIEKEIKIVGIKNENEKPRRGHILELN